jgi:transcriptional regulator with XRE-family HTH domain
VATKETLASWLRHELARRDWKYADLAERAGVSRASISRWVNGIELPESKNAVKLADALDANPDDVLAMAGHRVPLKPLSPDDPVSRLTRKLKRVKLDATREKMIDRILDLYLETDSETQDNRMFQVA